MLRHIRYSLLFLLIGLIGSSNIQVLAKMNPLVSQAHNIIATAWSPDGSKIAVGGTNGFFQIQNLSGRILHNVTDLSSAIVALDWSPDSRKIVTGGDDGIARVWDAQTGQPLAILLGSGSSISNVAWNHYGNQILVTASSISLWDATNYQLIDNYQSSGVYGAIWPPNKGRTGFGKTGGFLDIYVLDMSHPIVQFSMGADIIPTSWSWSGDGISVAAGTSEGTIKIWNTNTREPDAITSYIGHTQAVDAVAFSPNSLEIASASSDGTVRVWNVATAQQIARFAKPKTIIKSIAWSPDGSKLAFGGDDGKLQIVTVPSTSTNATTTPISAIVWNSDNTRIAVIRGSFFDIIDASHNIIQGTITPSFSAITGIDWSSDGEMLVTSSRDYPGVFIWYSDRLEVMNTQNASALSVKWHPDNIRVAVTLKNHTISIWNISTGKQISEAIPNSEFVDWSPNGKKLASANSDNGQITVVDMTAQHQLTLAGHQGGVKSIDWSPDGTKIVSGGSDNAIHVWDATSGALLLELTGHTGIVTSVAWNNRHAILASASNDGSLRLWNTQTGQTLRIIQTGVVISSVAWSPDGRRLAYCSENGSNLKIVALADLIKTKSPVAAPA